MPRRRIQEGPIGNGWVEEIRTEAGIKFVARWKKFIADPAAPGGRRRVDGGYHELGPKVHHGPGLRSKADAVKKWLKVCDSVIGRTSGIHPALKADWTFRHFAVEAEDGYKKTRETRWGESQREAFDYYMAKILPRFGDTKLCDMNDRVMQSFLNELAEQDYSKTVVEHCLIYLRSVLAEAVEEDILPKNPARKLALPKNTRKVERRWLSIEQYRELLANTLSRRDQIMMGLLYLGGLRRGELFGVKWLDFDGASLMIQRQIRARTNQEKDVKTNASRARIALPSELCAALNEWRQYATDPRPDGYIFACRKGTPINSKNWLERVLKPAAEAAGIPRIGYQMFRRGLATEGHQNGIGDKNLQGQLRHASVKMTQDVYMQNVVGAQQAAIERFARAVTAGSDSAA
jgi:integrase